MRHRLLARSAPVRDGGRSTLRSGTLTRTLWASLVVLGCALLLACSRDKPAAVTDAPTPSETPATAEQTALRYFGLWNETKYGELYDLLSAGSRQAIARERFVARHAGIADEARIRVIRAAPLGSVGENGDRAQARYRITYVTSIWGEVQQENALPLVRESGGWRVEWSPALIFKELKGSNLVRAVVDEPTRGAILDRSGTPLAITGSVPTVGTAKNLLNAPNIVADRNGTITLLATKLGIPAAEIRAKVDDPQTEVDVFIPLKTLPPTTPQAQVDDIEATPGVVVQRTARRLYPYGSAAAHVVGYIAPITAEQLQTLAARGYQSGDLVGGLGLEESYEAQLAGERGARLTIITPEGGQVVELAQRPGKAPRDVVTTIDITAQVAVAGALGERTGSAVLLDPRDNSVVAMASFPAFDPNAFVTGLSDADAGRVLNDPRTPLLNRVVAATYPPGSTFKVVTAAAGLEQGGFTTTSRVDCVPVWTGLGPNNPKRNWNTVAEGPQTVAEALMRSCNPMFYEIGLRLDGIDPTILTRFAAGFGFGKPTGLNGIEDAAGVEAGPAWKQRALNESWFTGDSVNMSIGQGFLLATPLQIANAYSAIAANGVLRSPLLVRELRESGTARATESFASKELGRLPVSPATLNVLRQGTTMVAQDPRGTAYSVFAGSRLDPAGKSGTAEDQGVQSHALFAAYAPRTNTRGVAVVVLDEGQSGSLEAGPITRRILEAWTLR